MNISRFVFVMIIALLTACNSAPQQTGSTSSSIAKDVSATEFSKKIDELDDEQLLDVRTPEEIADGHLPQAITINFHADDFEQQLNQLNKEKPVLVYCAAGSRSGKAMQIMKQNGFKEVYNLEGGYGAWEAANMKTVKD